MLRPELWTREELNAIRAAVLEASTDALFVGSDDGDKARELIRSLDDLDGKVGGPKPYLVTSRSSSNTPGGERFVLGMDSRSADIVIRSLVWCTANILDFEVPIRLGVTAKTFYAVMEKLTQQVDGD